MTTVTVDQAKLVLNSFAALFQNNLVSTNLVTWRKFDGEMNDRNGLTVVEQVTPDYYTEWTKSGVKDLSGGVQDTHFGSEQYSLTQTLSSSMGWGDFQKIKSIGDARESQALRKAAIRLATDVDSYIMRYAALASNNWVGNANGQNAVSTFADMADAVVRLKEEGVEDSFTAVLSYQDWKALGNDVVGNPTSMMDIAGGIYRQGFSGNIAGIPTIFTQQLPAVQVGDRVASATSVTDYATGDFDNDYKDVAISTAPGKYKSGKLNLKGQAGAKTLKDGEVFTIAGVYAWDPRAKKQLHHLQQFRVIGDHTAAAGKFSNVEYFPAVITSGPHKTVVNTNGGGSTWDGLAVTHLGVASSVVEPRFLANKDAIVINTADLIMPASDTAQRQSLTKVPLSVRMWRASEFDTGEHKIRFDVALEANVMADGRERIIRINGS
ncbi:MAG: P22 phage major capsid protein family protein [Vulcanimicrobiota bacterium]